MAVKVALNGFGRIGRLVFRQMFGHEGTEIVAINDLTSPDMLAYLLKYDSTQGKFNCSVKAENGKLVINGKPITIFQEQDAANIKWGDARAEYVVEFTGISTTMEKTGPT